MAGKKVTYPVINANRWWILRKSFKRSIPPQVTNNYLSSILSITVDSAQNIISPLKKIGLIDNDGTPTELANRWRDDEEYINVCAEMRKEVYPSELLAAFPDAEVSRTNVERWFSNKTGLGQGVVSSMAAFYLLLTKADPTEQESITASGKTSRPTKIPPPPAKFSLAKPKKSGNGVSKTSIISDASIATNGTVEATNGTTATTTAEPETKISSYKRDLEPSIHIDIQIHISSDADANQIDHIFASMAKHLYKGRNGNE